MEKEEIMATHFEVERREERNRKDMEMSGHLLLPHSSTIPSLLAVLSPLLAHDCHALPAGKPL